jgi:tetratricopeptide (TPR) repeat protein
MVGNVESEAAAPDTAWFAGLPWGAWVAALGVALLAVYSNHFQNSFHFDDSHSIEANAYLRDLKNLPRFFTDASTQSALPANQSYRPLVLATLAIDYRLAGGLDTVWFHVDSFAFFFLQCGLMLLLFRRVLGDRWLALFGTALYGLHTAMAETVNYLCQRAEILSTLGAVAALLLWARGGRARRFHLYLLPAAASILAKEQGAMTAPLLLLYVALIERHLPIRALLRPRDLGPLLRTTWPAFALCGAGIAFSLRMSTHFTPATNSRWLYALTQPWVLLHYAAMFVAPVALSADTDWTVLPGLSDPRAWAGFAFVAAALALAVRASDVPRTRPIAFGLLWFFVALLPTSSVVPLAEVLNDHRLYFPFVGLALAAACAGGLLFERFGERSRRPIPLARPALLGAALLLLAAHGVGAHLRNRVWRSEATLWADVVAKSPGNARGWMNYGLDKMGKGRWSEAERAYEKALALAPCYGYAHVNLAILFGSTGRPAEAERHFRLGIQYFPGVPSFRYFFARWLHEVGRDEEAVGLLREAIAGAPAEAAAHRLLLQILAQQRRWTELGDAARSLLRIQGDDPEALRMLALAAAREKEPGPPGAPEPGDAGAWITRSLRLYQERRFAESLAASEEAARLDPRSAIAHNNRCAALNELRRWEEAAAACREALRLAPDDQLARNNLAWALEGASRRGAP